MEGLNLNAHEGAYYEAEKCYESDHAQNIAHQMGVSEEQKQYYAEMDTSQSLKFIQAVLCKYINTV